MTQFRCFALFLTIGLASLGFSPMLVHNAATIEAAPLFAQASPTSPPIGYAEPPASFASTAHPSIPGAQQQPAVHAVLIDQDEVDPGSLPPAESVELQATFTLTMTLSPNRSAARRFNYCSTIPGSPNLNWTVVEMPEAGWIDTTPKSGVLPALACQPMTTIFNTTGLKTGVYKTTLRFISNAVNSPLDLPVALTVWAEPEIRLRAFIPTKAVRLDLGVWDCLFAGDGRSFAYESGTHRAQQTVTITVDPTRPPISSGPTRLWGTSSRYAITQGTASPTGPEWEWILKPGASPEAVATLPVTQANNRVDVTRAGNVTTAQFTIAGSNPVASPCGGLPIGPVPDLDASIKVSVRQEPGKQAQYKVTGLHNGFPAYELYLDRTLICSYNPLIAGRAPSSLVGPATDPFNSGDWQNLTSVRNCNPTRALRINYARSRPGSPLTLTGTAFTANTSLAMKINGRSVGTVTTDATGRFQRILDTTSANAGVYLVDMTSTTAHVEQFQAGRITFVLEQSAPLRDRDAHVPSTIKVPSGIGIPKVVFIPSIRQ